MTTEAAYEPIDLRYRPSKLDDLVGQDAAVKTLRGMISSKRINRRILCSGPHGLGKTTLARLIAMSINCSSPIDGGACGACKTCRAILHADQNTSVHEINGADSRKIEDARELIQTARYAPRDMKYRVFILDEVHQLTAEAFKSLLKILEEPPLQTVFVLCTTDPTKVPVEIRSRMLKLFVRPVGPEQLAKHIKRIAKAEGKPISGQVALKIATATRGHVRDAMNLLESFLLALAGSKDEPDVDALLDELLGDASDALASAFVLHTVNGDTQRAMMLLRKVYNHQVFCESVTRFATHVVLQKAGERDPHLSEFYDEVKQIDGVTTERAAKQLSIWNDAAARVKSYQTNDPFAVMVAATVMASETK
jgi:DNA polymerase-3 subunit gamma/tau